MPDDGQEKTEFVSQKRIEESREKGELPRSQEFTTFVVITLFLIYFSMARLSWFHDFGELMTDMLTFDRHLDINRNNVQEFMLWPAVKTFMIMAPLFGVVLFVSPLVNMAQTQFNLASKKLTPDINRLNPANGFKRIFSLRQVVEGVKSSLKIGLFVWLSWTAVRKHIPVLMTLAGHDILSQLNAMIDVALSIGIRIAILMSILAMLDYAYQWWEFNKKMRMTMQELKDEMKEREGNPLIKQRQRSIQMRRARERMMNKVPKATVVVANPTHFAVAILYRRGVTGAPIVVAKGKDLVAQRIKQIARENEVPIIEDKPLARGLYRVCKVGKTIPSEFFKAVAETLAFVYYLRRKKGRKYTGDLV